MGTKPNVVKEAITTPTAKNKIDTVKKREITSTQLKSIYIQQQQIL